MSDDIQELSFYSAPTTPGHNPADHAYNLRQSMAILPKVPPSTNGVATGAMTVLPLMQQLELMLQKKSTARGLDAVHESPSPPATSAASTYLAAPSVSSAVPHYDPERVYGNQPSRNKRFLKVTPAESEKRHTRSQLSISVPLAKKLTNQLSFSVPLVKKPTNHTISNEASSPSPRPSRKRSSTLEKLRFLSFSGTSLPQPLAPQPKLRVALDAPPKKEKKGFFRSLFRVKLKPKLVESQLTPNMKLAQQPPPPQPKSIKQNTTQQKPAQPRPQSAMFAPPKKMVLREQLMSPVVGSATDDSVDFDTSLALFEYRDDPPQKLTVSKRRDEEMKPDSFLERSPGAGFGLPLPTASPKTTSPSPALDLAVPLLQVTSSPSNPHRITLTSLRALAREDALLGEALFPKLLNPQEVELIVLLERLRSMRLIRLNKRSLFVGYNGDSENITHISLPQQLPRTGLVKRLLLILKHLSLRKLVRLPTANTTLEPALDDGDFSEFSDFLDLDNVSFNHSPIVTARALALLSPALIQVPALIPVTADHLDAVLAAATPAGNINQLGGPLQPPVMSGALASALGGPPTPPPATSTPDSSPVATTDLSDVTEESTSPKSPKSPTEPPIESLAASTTSNSGSYMSTPGTNQAPMGANPTMTLALPPTGSVQKKPLRIVPPSPSSSQDMGYSPILETAVKMLPIVDGRMAGTNRPVLMLFRGFANSNNSWSEWQDLDTLVGGGFGLELEDERSKDKVLGLRNVVKPPHMRVPLLDSPRLFSLMFTRKLNKKLSQTLMALSRTAPLPMITSTVRFSSRIILYDTYNCEEYDRHPETATCNQLTPALAQQIKEELNTFKSQMEIHVESRSYTHFF